MGDFLSVYVHSQGRLWIRTDSPDPASRPTRPPPMELAGSMPPEPDEGAAASLTFRALEMVREPQRRRAALLCRPRARVAHALPWPGAGGTPRGSARAAEPGERGRDETTEQGAGAHHALERQTEFGPSSILGSKLFSFDFPLKSFISMLV